MTQKQNDIQFLEAYQQYLLNAYEAFWELLPCDLHEPPTRCEIINQLIERAQCTLKIAEKEKCQIRAGHLRKYAGLLNNRIIRSQHADNLIARRDKRDERRQAIREKIAIVVDEHGEDSSLFLDIVAKACKSRAIGENHIKLDCFHRTQRFSSRNVDDFFAIFSKFSHFF